MGVARGPQQSWGALPSSLGGNATVCHTFLGAKVSFRVQPLPLPALMGDPIQSVTPEGVVSDGCHATWIMTSSTLTDICQAFSMHHSSLMSMRWRLLLSPFTDKENNAPRDDMLPQDHRAGI